MIDFPPMTEIRCRSCRHEGTVPAEASYAECGACGWFVSLRSVARSREPLLAGSR